MKSAIAFWIAGFGTISAPQLALPLPDPGEGAAWSGQHMAAAIQTNARELWVMREETGNPGHRQPRNKTRVRGPEFTFVREERLISLVPADWQEAFALMDSRFPSAGPTEKEARCGLFASRKLVSEHVKKPFLVSNATSELPSVSGTCVNYLADRQAYREMADIGLEADMGLKTREIAACGDSLFW
jgi:hypothetical protein